MNIFFISVCIFSFFQGLNGGTTVAGTVIVSGAVGIKVFATGNTLFWFSAFPLGLLKTLNFL
jgi:hypothetical protein